MQEDNYLYMYIQSQLYKHLIIWTPYYYAQLFALSLGERKLLHFLNIQPALFGHPTNTDTFST